jgi:hypothetical protein
MSDIVFGPNDIIKFPTRYHGEVTLSKWKWDLICAQPERIYYRYNGEKVPTTLMIPDYVRHHPEEPNQFLYYKQFDHYKVDQITEISLKTGFCCVIIDVSKARVCTIYPRRSLKIGKDFRPPEDKK